jgi:glucose-1-phosphate cytidylyltransferase
MKVAILAGGLGTRFSEETVHRPKPLVEIGGRPILCHVMDIYSRFGFKEFVIATGYKKEMIAKYFTDYYTTSRNLTVNMGTGQISPHEGEPLEWLVHLIDTGPDTMTGGRIKRLAPYLDNETFMLTWCDGLADIDIGRLLAFHRSHGRLATVTAVQPPSRFGQMRIEDDRVVEFAEKPADGGGWINGAFFVLEPGVFDYIDGDQTMWEQAPMERLTADGQVMAYSHSSFWQCMDSQRDRDFLQRLWDTDKAPWRQSK